MKELVNEDLFDKVVNKPWVFMVLGVAGAVILALAYHFYYPFFARVSAIFVSAMMAGGSGIVFYCGWSLHKERRTQIQARNKRFALGDECTERPTQQKVETVAHVPHCKAWTVEDDELIAQQCENLHKELGRQS